MTFAGESLVIGPDGSIVGKADDKELLFFADVDLGAIAASRQARDYLKARRPAMYPGLTQ